MVTADRLNMLILDDHWRPRHRIPLDGGWHDAVHQMLRHDGRWLALHQRRAKGSAVLPEAHDIALTRSILRRLRALDMQLADHLIRAGERRFSFRAAGLL